MLKSPPQLLCEIFWSLWMTFSSKNSVLVASEILKMFVNILIPNDKYSLSVKVSVESNEFKCNYLQNQNYFVNFFF